MVYTMVSVVCVYVCVCGWVFSGDDTNSARGAGGRGFGSVIDPPA